MPHAQETFMSKAINIAKFTFAFVVIAGSVSLIIGSLMGGGFSSRYNELKGINDDPRSIFVQAILIESENIVAEPIDFPEHGTQLTNSAFNDLLEEAGRLRAGDSALIRTPSMLVQHSETGSVSVTLGDQSFDAAVSPSVIDTKHGPVLRVAIEIRRTDTDSAATPREMVFATAYTAAPGSAMVLDLAGLGLPGTRSVLALHTTLIDPTPVASN